jgi:hypothetical protein
MGNYGLSCSLSEGGRVGIDIKGVEYRDKKAPDSRSYQRKSGAWFFLKYF